MTAIKSFNYGLFILGLLLIGLAPYSAEAANQKKRPVYEIEIDNYLTGFMTQDALDLAEKYSKKTRGESQLYVAKRLYLLKKNKKNKKL